MCDSSLSCLWGPLYMCATLLWGQEGHVHCRVTGCWVCSPGPLSPASSSSEALDEIELLDSWHLAVGGTVEVLTPLAHLQDIPQLNWHCLMLSLHNYPSQQSVHIFCCSNFGFLLGQLIMATHTPTVKWLLGRITSCLCNTVDVNWARSLRNETQYCRFVKGDLQRKGWQINFCLLQPDTIVSL
jgi:hypothetical protein